MILLDDKHLLMIEPHYDKEPYILDDLTQKAELVYMRAKTPQYGYRGFHQCACGATSDNLDHILPDGTITNSLMVHYIAEHRAEVPQSEIDKLERLYKAFTEPHIIGAEPDADDVTAANNLVAARPKAHGGKYVEC